MNVNLDGIHRPPNGRKCWPWIGEIPSRRRSEEADSDYPRICIVTPSFNQGEFLEATIRSVLLQGYPNLEYRVIDGGSSDNSIEVIRSFEKELDFWVSEPDRGQAHAINKGFEPASGKIFGWLNADDILLPGALEAVAHSWREQSDAVAWVGGCHRIDMDGKVLSTVVPWGLELERLADWACSGGFYQPSCFFSAAKFREVGGLEENLHFAMDVDLWLHLIKKGRFAVIDRVLSAALIHDGAKTRASRERMQAETVKVQFHHGLDDVAMEYLVRLLKRKRTRKLSLKGMLRRSFQGLKGITKSRK